MSKPKINPTDLRILVVDDVPANLKILRDTLENEGYRVFPVPDGARALEVAEKAIPDMILLDIMMPGMDGYQVCQRLKANQSTAGIPVIFITAQHDKKGLVKAFDVGGVDYITKPFEKAEVLLRVETHLRINQLTRQLSENNDELQSANEALMEVNKQLREEIARREQAEQARDREHDAREKADEQIDLLDQREELHWGIEGIIGKSKTIANILEEIHQLQDVGAISVLITGESGTGKELIARAIHFGGKRSCGRFVPLNCSAIPAELAEATLFGYTRGAFTGADRSRKGLFEHADSGTLFLDEIGNMSLDLQVKLLRVLEDGRFTPVGSTDEKQVDVRVLAATNADLMAKIRDGFFRNDLYFRIARFTVEVPPLRQRQEDIPLLTQHFLEQFSAEMGHQNAVLSQEAQEMLFSYDFPGNVRELKNIIEHALIRSGGEQINPEHLCLIDYPEPLGAASEQTYELQHDRTAPLFPRRPRTEEDLILDYVRTNSSINNSECRALFGTGLDHASYLLRKMHKASLLLRTGTRRSARYHLPS